MPGVDVDRLLTNIRVIVPIERSLVLHDKDSAWYMINVRQAKCRKAFISVISPD